MNEEQLREQLAKVYSSTSWRITAPLRILGSILKRRWFPFDATKKFIVALIRHLARSDVLRRAAKRIFVYFPSLGARVRRILLQHSVEGLSTSSEQTDKILDQKNLSTEANLILRQLTLLRKTR